jgi:thiamine-phosphate pyrophosphorylase
MRTLRECRLYGIVDLAYVEKSEIDRVARELISGGVDVIQLRAKALPLNEIAELGRGLHSLAAAAGVPLIINDHPDVAREVGAEGVHVGQDDLSIAEARRIMGRKSWVGKSTHSIDQAIAAEAEGADYIGFGPLFATPTKPDYEPVGLEDVLLVHEQVRVPIFCIGGIKLENLPDVIAAGADRVVIVSGLLLAADIANYARATKRLLTVARKQQSQT